MGLSSLNEVVSRHLYETFGHPIVFSTLADQDFKLGNPLFAVHIENLKAKNLGDALEFANNYALDIASLIGIERGERPSRCAVFIADESGFSLHPISDEYRGNIAPPLLNQQAVLLERYLPVLENSLRARLDLELYAQALAERNYGFQYFRLWSLLELIAARHVRSDRIEIAGPDGRSILDSAGRRQTTKIASAKVYQYLFASKLEIHFQLWKHHDGRQVIMPGTTLLAEDSNIKILSLWDAVRAVNRIRNFVAHTGYFQPDEGSTNEVHVNASKIFLSQPINMSFLSFVTSAALFRELDSTPTTST
jgi:hypothetical protein